MVTGNAKEGGLGFDYKWDIGWMHDTLTYFQSPPHQRPGKYHQLTFSMDYFYNERYLLPLSHDEGVHGKATIAQKMYGGYEGKFPQARALYLYMMAHPGKKLNFMGFELAQLREWDERRQQDWELLRYPVHDGFAHFIQTLNHLYLESPALWQQDYSREGFRWLACEPGPACLYAWERRGGGQRLVCLVCLGDAPAAGTLQIPGAQRLTCLLSTEEARFGGKEPALPQVQLPQGGAFPVALAPNSGQLWLVGEGSCSQ